MALLTLLSVHIQKPEIPFGEQPYVVDFDQDLSFFQ